MESLEYEPAWALGANCGNDNVASVAKMIHMANNYGMDAIEIGDVLATYVEALKPGTTPMAMAVWSAGDYMGMIDLIDKVAYREGIGNVLADGVEPTAQYFGHPEMAMSVKGSGHPGL